MYVLRARGKIDPVDALYAELCGQLARRGLTRAADEGPQRYAERIVQAELPAPKRAAIVEFLALVSRYKYAPAPSHANLVGTLKTLLTQSR